MDSKKITIEKKGDISQTAAFLRLLADELEGKSGQGGSDFGCQLHEFNKLKIKLIKREGGQLSLTVKVKNSSQAAPLPAAADFTDIAAQEYRPFKRRFKSTFAEVTSCASQATLPASDLLARFMAEAQQMISFPGFGDPYYEEFRQACLSVEQAVRDGSTARFQETWTALVACKKACHRRFK